MKFCFFFIFLLASAAAFAQGWGFKAELGTNMSGLPKSDNIGTGKERIVPKIRPLVGIHFQRYSRFGLYADVGVRYTNAGDRVVFHKSDVNTLTNIRHTIDSEEDFSFMKLSYGLEVGYQFKLLKLPFNFLCGYRRISYVSGRYHYTYRTQQTDGQEYSSEKLYNPFTSPDIQMKADPNGWEIFAGLGATIAKRYTIQFQYSLNDGLVFVEHLSGHTPYDWHRYGAGDLCLSLLYKLKK